MGCPQCQGGDISDSGVCLSCGYVISIEPLPETSEPAAKFHDGEIPADTIREEFNDGTDSDGVDPIEGSEHRDAMENKPGWRQELSERLQALKKKRETTGLSKHLHVGDASLAASQSRAPMRSDSAAMSIQAMQAYKPAPKPKSPPPRQKRLQALDLGVSSEKIAPEQAEKPDVRALIDSAVAGKSVPLPPSDDSGGIPESMIELPPDDEGKLILLSRTLSGLVDLIIVLLCSGLCVIAADFFSGIIALDSVSYMIFSALFLLTYFFYSLFFLGTVNQTVGMMITDLRVTDVSGARPSISQLLRRCWGYLASILVLGLGLLWSLFDRESQCFHDRISDTRVVRF